MSDDQGQNLLEPGSTPHENQQFVVFLTAVIRAVDLHGDLLRASVAHAGNDHRLGANEAPPAIISIFLGEALTEVVESLAAGSTPVSREKAKMSLGVTTLPPLPKDLTDRNRTSPFAFTGNKFEFRAVGSSQSVALPNVTLNTIVAESLEYLATEIERRAKGGNLNAAVQDTVGETLRKHKRILFGGNNYSEEWQIEAERRGLPNLRNTVDALAVLANDANIALFEKYGVYNRREAEARYTIAHEAYTKAIAIEAQSASGIASTAILPAAVEHQRRLAEAVNATRAAIASLDLAAEETSLKEVSALIGRLKSAIESLQDAAEKADKHHNGSLADHARVYRDTVVPAIAKVREIVDRLETVVDDDLWPLPKYREMLFLH
jgi:glutamine synthetase